MCIRDRPGAMLSGKWDYCDKLFQWMIPPRILLLGFVILIACFLTVINIFLSIKWWGLLLFIGITFSLAVPDYLVDKQFKKAIISLPILFFLMFLNLFRLSLIHILVCILNILLIFSGFLYGQYMKHLYLV